LSGLARPSVSITVVAYNSDHCIRACLLSVLPVVRKGFAELIVIDNASPDESAQIVRDEFREATLVCSKVNRGFAGGHNFVWPQTRGRYWLLLNPDVIVPPGGVERLVAWMDEHPELGVGSPELVDGEDNLACVGRRFLCLSRAILEMSRLHLFMSRQHRAEYFQGAYRRDGIEHFDVDFVVGAAMIVRREAVESTGLLLEGLLMYGEDVEWCSRIRKAGWRIGVYGTLRFRHDEGQSARRTWGEAEQNWRMWLGTYLAYAQMRGRLYSCVLIAVNALAFAIESCHPRRSALERCRFRKHLRSHVRLLRCPSVLLSRIGQPTQV